MAIISRIGQLLNTPIGTKAAKTTGHSSNPFAASTFKGNVLTADVFETKITKKNKLTYSALVGSLGDAFPTFRKGIETVTAFAKRVKEDVTATFRRLNEIGNMEITIDFAAPGRAFKNALNNIYDQYSVRRLVKNDVGTLENMWKELSTLNVAV